MNYSSDENLVLVRDENGSLSWEVVFTEFIEYALDYLEIECGCDVDGLEAITLIKSGSILSGLDFS